MVTIELRLVGINWTRSAAAKVLTPNLFGVHAFVFDVHGLMRVIGTEHRCQEVFGEWRFRAMDDMSFSQRERGDQFQVLLTLDGHWVDDGLRV